MSALHLHAEQKLLDYVKSNGIDVAEIYTYFSACPDGLVNNKYA